MLSEPPSTDAIFVWLCHMPSGDNVESRQRCPREDPSSINAQGVGIERELGSRYAANFKVSDEGTGDEMPSE